jgi:hypothetical protein
MRLIWKLAVLSLWPLAIAAHVATRTPSSKPAAKVRGETPVNLPSVSAPIPPGRDYVICPVVGPCWKDGKPISGAL